MTLAYMTSHHRADLPMWLVVVLCVAVGVPLMLALVAIVGGIGSAIASSLTHWLRREPGPVWYRPRYAGPLSTDGTIYGATKRRWVLPSYVALATAWCVELFYVLWCEPDGGAVQLGIGTAIVLTAAIVLMAWLPEAWIYTSGKRTTRGD